MKQGVRNALAGLGAGLAIGASVFAKPPVSQVLASQVFEKEKAKIEAREPSEKAKIELREPSAPFSASNSSIRTVGGLSVEPATTAALARRLSNARVIFFGMDHVFDLDRDKSTQILCQTHDTLRIGAVLTEDLSTVIQDSISAFYQTGAMNSPLSWNVKASWPSGQHSKHSIMWLLTEAYEQRIEPIGLNPDRSQPQYDFLKNTKPFPVDQYVRVSNVDMLATIVRSLEKFPNQRIFVEVGAMHVSDLQASLKELGISAASFTVWAPSMDLKLCTTRGSNLRVASVLNKNLKLCKRYLPRLSACPLGTFIVDNPNKKLSTLADFIVYTNDSTYWEADYMRRTPRYLWPEIQRLESSMGRDWMVEQRLMDSTGVPLPSIPMPKQEAVKP